MFTAEPAEKAKRNKRNSKAKAEKQAAETPQVPAPAEEQAPAETPAEQAPEQAEQRPLPTVEEQAQRYCRAIDKLLAKLDELEVPYSGPNAERFKPAKAARRTAENMARSTCEKPVATVKRICAENPGKARTELVALCIEAGVTKATARTQVQVWLKAQKAD